MRKYSKERRTFEEDLEILLKKAQKAADLSIEEILEILTGNGRLLILLFLSLPFCQPLQIPGLSIPFGIVVTFIGLRMALGKVVWLPKRILSVSVPSTTIQKLAAKTLQWVKKMRRFIRPRLERLCHGAIMKKVNGFSICFLGAFLALPLPIPLTNLIAGLAIFLMSLGLLENDGLLVVFGYLFLLLIIILIIFIIFSVGLIA